MVIGEAVNHLDSDLLDRHREVPWHSIAALRNRITHGYFGIDWNLIWHTVTVHLPSLSQTVTRILEEEFGEQ